MLGQILVDFIYCKNLTIVTDLDTAFDPTQDIQLT